MTADFGFVTDAAEGNALEFSAKGFGDAATEGGFSDTGRANEAEDGATEGVADLADGEKICDAVFHLVEAVMVAVKDCDGFFDVDGIFGECFPGEGEEPVEIVADDHPFGGAGGSTVESADFLEGSFECLFGHAAFFELLAVGVAFFREVIAATEFVLNGAELFAEVVLALGLPDFAFDFGTELGLKFENLEFAGEDANEVGHALFGVEELEEGLFGLGSCGEMVGDCIGELPGILDCGDGFADFGRNLDA